MDFPEPFRLTPTEVRLLLSLTGSKVIDLFGGSGAFSFAAHKSDREVIYNDIQPWVKKAPFTVLHWDFEDAAYLSDRKTTIFADPPFFKVPCFCKWDSQQHRRLFKVLEDVDGRVIMLNRASLNREGWIEIPWNLRTDEQLKLCGMSLYFREE